MADFVLQGPQKNDNNLGAWREEILGYYQEIQKLNVMDAEGVFQLLSQCSARASEIRFWCWQRPEDKKLSAFRIRIIDPFIDEIDRQFKTQSRLVSVREFEYRVTTGER